MGRTIKTPISSHKAPSLLKEQMETQNMNSASERKLMISHLVSSMQTQPKTEELYRWYSMHEQEVNRAYRQIYQSKEILACYNPEELTEKIDRMIYCMIEPKRWPMLL